MTVADRIRAFVVERYGVPGEPAPDDDTALFSSGKVDSFGVLELIAFLEDAFGVDIDTARHEIREFDTVARIAALLGQLGIRA
jgi:acyl carrier protein